MRGSGFLGFIVLLLLVGAVGTFAYHAGVSSVASGVSSPEVGMVNQGRWGFDGISPFGLLVGAIVVLIVLGFVARLVAGPHTGHGHWSQHGPGGWSQHGRGPWSHDSHGRWSQDDDVPSRFRPMLERWHERAHRHDARDQGPAASGPHAPSWPGQPGQWPYPGQGQAPPPGWQPPAEPPR
jgi:hypothetical protein